MFRIRATVPSCGTHTRTDDGWLCDIPQYFSIVGYSRSKMSDEEFRDLISENLTCRVTSGEDCGREMEEYLDRCTYVAVRARGLDLG